MRSVILTERLTLAPLGKEDAPTLIALLRDPGVNGTYMVPDLDTPDARNALFDRFYAFTHREDRFARGIYLDGRLIGMIHDVGMEEGEVELGWFVDPASRGRGFAPEALAAAVRELFAEGFRVIKAGAFTENAASLRVMEKCGMRPTGEREIVSYRGRDRECVYTAITVAPYFYCYDRE